MRIRETGNEDWYWLSLYQIVQMDILCFSFLRMPHMLTSWWPQVVFFLLSQLCSDLQMWSKKVSMYRFKSRILRVCTIVYPFTHSPRRQCDTWMVTGVPTRTPKWTLWHCLFRKTFVKGDDQVLVEPTRTNTRDYGMVQYGGTDLCTPSVVYLLVVLVLLAQTFLLTNNNPMWKLLCIPPPIALVHNLALVRSESSEQHPQQRREGQYPPLSQTSFPNQLLSFVWFSFSSALSWRWVILMEVLAMWKLKRVWPCRLCAFVCFSCPGQRSTVAKSYNFKPHLIFQTSNLLDTSRHPVNHFSSPTGIDA